MTLHRFVRHHAVMDYLRVGWLALHSLDGTTHGQWSVHCVWLCACDPVEPSEAA